MAKNKYLSEILFAIALSVASAQPARAQLVAGVSFDFAADAIATMAPIFEQVQTMQDMVVSFQRQIVSDIKAMAAKYLGLPQRIMSKVPSKKIAENSSVDIYSQDAVQAAVKELFLQYPSTDPVVMAAYEAKAQEFYYDTLIEMTMSASVLEENFNKLRANVQKIEKDATDPNGGSGSSASGDDENGNYYNLYLIYREFNNTLKITEEVMAMYAQYYTARSIYKKQVIPAPYEEKTDKKAGGKKTKTSALTFNQSVAFAQFIAKSDRQVATVRQQTPQLAKKNEASVAKIENDGVAAKMLTIGGVEFGVAQKLDIKSPLQNNRKQLEDLVKLSEVEKTLNQAMDAHNTLQMMPTYRNMFKQYELLKQLHQKATEAVSASDQCVLGYLGRRYKNPKTVWYGSENVPEDVVDYDARKGLSGWTISAYQVSNSFKTAGLDVDSFVPVTDVLDIDDSNPLDTAELEKQREKENKQETNSTLTQAGDAQQFSDTVREVELLNWQIGAEATKILAADQYSDKPAYGKAEHPYPLWRDQKNFYNLYLTEKYNNMAEYIRKTDLNGLALEIAKIINDASDKEESKTYGTYIGRLKAELNKNKGADGKAEKIAQGKEAALKALAAAKEAEMKPLLAEQKRIQERMNGLSAEVKTISDDILAADNAAKEAKMKEEAAHENLKDLAKRNADSSSVLYGTAAVEIEQGKRESAVQKEKISGLKITLEERKKELEQVSGQLEQAENKIKQAEQQYVLKAGAIERDYSSQMNKAAKENSAGVDLLALISSKNMAVPGFKSLISQALGLTDDAKDEAIELINKAKKDILNMGDDLYDAQKHAKVVNRHRQLIKDLKQLSRTNLMKKVASLILTSGKSSVTSLLSQAFTKSIGSICSKVSCNQPDTEYFVGYPAKDKDFVAPREPLSEHYPPVHDIVHFDYDDYKNLLDKTNNLEYGVAVAFADYGQELPGIWKTILTENPFVEKSVNLGALLRNNGGEDIAFMRGMRYPCLYENKYVVDVSGGKKPRYLISRDINKNMPVCHGIKLVDNGMFFTVFDLESNDKERGEYIHDQAETQSGLPKISPSELGMFLGYSSDAYFNDSPRAAFERIAVLNEAAEDDGSFKYTMRDMIFRKSMFNENQIGNFLHFVDKEHNIRKNVEEIAVSIDDTRKSIVDMLAQLGFSVAADFNLANDKDYAYIRGKLDELKNGLVGSATAEIEEVDYNDEIVKERYDKINNLRAALVQDSTELVSLNSSVSAGSSLAESILTEKANQKVLEETQKAGENAILDEIKNYEVPLCTVY